MSVQINNYKSVGKTENYTVSPDDRQELVQLVDGAVAIDGWDGTRQNDGDVVGFTATFTHADAQAVIGLWNNRTLTTVQLEDGSAISNARIIIKRISYPDPLPFRAKYTVLDIEVWRV